ncbi:MAG: winged helix-turn-helix transcriptional regulator [Euryarchaeota archaeon]|nr:winged helix-turn-helix transcriptional regulator [Euryarchaeota archaeon]
MPLSRVVPLILLAGLLALPGLLAATSAGADEEPGFTLAPFESGATYRYDATYRILSPDVRQWTVRDQLTLEVGAPETWDLVGRSVLPITITHTIAPWDRARLPMAHDGPGALLAAEGQVVRTLHIDIETGEPVQSRTTHGLALWSRPEGGSMVAEDQWGRVEEPRPAMSPFFTSPVWPGLRYVPHGHADAAADVGTYSARGLLDGRTVYDVGPDGPVTAARAARGPTCDHPYPQPGGVLVPFADPADVPTTVGVETRQVWLDPTIPFPVLSVCRHLYPHSDGGLRTQVLSELRLSDLSPGDRSIDVPRPDGRAEEPMRAGSATDAPGVPREDRRLLRFPLHEAYEEASDVEDLGYRHFRTHDDERFTLTAASYRVHTADEDAEGLEGLVADLTRIGGDAPVLLEWTVTLQNDRGERLTITVSRRVDSDGDLVSAGKRTEAFHAGHGDLGRLVAPERLMALDTLLLRWSETTHRDLDQWQTTPGAVLDHRISDDSATLTIGGRAMDPTPLDRLRTYRLSDGALLRDATWERSPRNDQSLPQGPTPEPLSASATRVHPHPEDGLGLAEKTGLWAAAALGLATLLHVGKGLLLPLYAKISRERVLDHGTRDEILHYVRANPGANAEEIRRRILIGRGTALHHLDTLERNRLLVSIKSGGRRCYFEPGQIDASKKATVATLRSRAAEAFYAAVQERPGLTQKEMAERLGVSHPAVWYQARKLEEAGIIRSERCAGSVRYFAAPGA